LAIAEKSPLKRTIVGHEPITVYPAISISFLSIDSNPAAQVMMKFIIFKSN